MASFCLLYGTPFWFPTITTTALDKMTAVVGRTMIRVLCGYRTVSHAVAVVLSGIHPLLLLAEERIGIYRGIDRRVVRELFFKRWKRKWAESDEEC